jgi:hypothetical protein
MKDKTAIAINIYAGESAFLKNAIFLKKRDTNIVPTNVYKEIIEVEFLRFWVKMEMGKGRRVVF